MARLAAVLSWLLMCDSQVFGASHVSHFMQTQDYWYFQIITIINWQFQHCIISHFVFCVIPFHSVYHPRLSKSPFQFFLRAPSNKTCQGKLVNRTHEKVNLSRETCSSVWGAFVNIARDSALYEVRSNEMQPRSQAFPLLQDWPTCWSNIMQDFWLQHRWARLNTTLKWSSYIIHFGN